MLLIGAMNRTSALLLAFLRDLPIRASTGLGRHDRLVPGRQSRQCRRPGDRLTGYGAVPYAYNIGTYDVTNSQYVEFLNTKDPTGANLLGSVQLQHGGRDLWRHQLQCRQRHRQQVQRHCGPPEPSRQFRHLVRHDSLRQLAEQRPGQRRHRDGRLHALGRHAHAEQRQFSITRNAGATVFLPSENEWYKAAYYNPATSSYFQYPTSSNTAPNRRGSSGRQQLGELQSTSWAI